VLSATEAAEFVLDAWAVQVLVLGTMPFRMALAHVQKERDGRVFYQRPGELGRLSDAQNVFKESFAADGDLVISSSVKSVHFADRSQSTVDEEDVLKALQGKYGFHLVDISTPTEKELERIMVPWGALDKKLWNTAARVFETHGAKIKYVDINGPAAFAHDGVHYINLKNKDMREYVQRLHMLTDDIVFTYICGLVQKTPFKTK